MSSIQLDWFALNKFVVSIYFENNYFDIPAGHSDNFEESIVNAILDKVRVMALLERLRKSCTK